MSQYNSMSPLFKEFGFPVLEELLKNQTTREKKEDIEVVELKDDKEIKVKVREDMPKV